ALQAPSPLIPSFAPLARRLQALADALPEVRWPLLVHEDIDDEDMPAAVAPADAQAPEPLPVAEELAGIGDLSAYFDPALLEASFAGVPAQDASRQHEETHAPSTAADDAAALQVFEWPE